jgi:hypothetical protein
VCDRHACKGLNCLRDTARWLCCDKGLGSHLGFAAGDAQALIIHEAISIGFAMFTWTSAYHLRPTMLLARVVPARAVGPKWLGTGYKAAASTAARQVDKMAWLKRLPGSDPQRLTVALTESLCFR